MKENVKYDESKPLEMHNLQFDLAAEKLDVEAWILNKIKQPRRELSVTFPLRLDNGDTVLLSGYRVQHNTLRGPGKGGIRYHPQSGLGRGARPGRLDDLEVRGGQHSLWRGQGGGDLRPPAACLPHELERMTRRYIWEISPIIGPEQDIPAPDVNTNPQTMAWIVDTYSVFKGYHLQQRGHRQAPVHRRLPGAAQGHLHGLPLRLAGGGRGPGRGPEPARAWRCRASVTWATTRPSSSPRRA